MEPAPSKASKAPGGDTGDQGDEVTVTAAVMPKPKKVYARLAKHSPYIGFFHHGPSAGNRSRRTYFERDIMSMEDVQRQHEVRSNAMIGIFHYGHDLYGERYHNFQRILAKLRAKTVEREVEAVLCRHARTLTPFGGTMNPAGGAKSSAAAIRDHGRARSISNAALENGDGVLRTSRALSGSRVTPPEDGQREAATTRQAAAVPLTRDASGDDGEDNEPTVLPRMLHRANTVCTSSPTRRTTDNKSNNDNYTSSAAAEGLTLGGPLPASPRQIVVRGPGLSGDTDNGMGACAGPDGAAGADSQAEAEMAAGSASGRSLSTVGRGDDTVGAAEGDDAVEGKRVTMRQYQEIERRRLRSNAFAVVVYGSGDSLVKMAEKERRNGGATKRFKYAGAIDTSKAYPKSGTLDDCALLRPVVAERSKLYNDLIAETNGFRRHFFLRKKMCPKEAYRQARRRLEVEAAKEMDMAHMEDLDGRGRMKSDSWLFNDGSYSSIGSEGAAANMNGQMNGAGGGMSANGSGGGTGAGAGTGPGGAGDSFYGGGAPGAGGGAVSGGGVGAGGFYDTPARMDDGAPPFHTLVGPGQFLRHTSADAEQPGGTWMPGTVSAQRAKESWRGKQEMRDFRKFKPFFVQAKTDFTATYKLLDDCVLGEGSYASVYLAIHIKRGEQVAVKAVQKRLLFSEREKKSVMAEIDNQLRIVHKHIVRLYEVYETQDNVFIVLENCPCGDLEKMMYLRGRLTEIEAKRVTMQLLEGLDYLHNKGIVHCDIKPQNLLFANDPDSPDAGTEEAAEAAKTSGVAADGGRPGGGKQQVASPAGRLAKLCDFGISCKVPDVRFYKQTGDINKIPWSGLFGTGGYIAPEIMRQEPFGKPADLWSVGVMLYQMISGRLPFIPARICVSKAVAFPPTVWGDVSVAAKDLICGLLEKDPAQRLTASQALQHPWIKTIHHLRPSFPHFVPVASRGNSTSASSAAAGSTGGGSGDSRREN